MSTKRNAFIVALRFYSWAYHDMRVTALQDAVGRRGGGGKRRKERKKRR